MRQFENIDTVIRDIVSFDGYDYPLVAKAVKRAFQELYDMSLIDDGIKYFNHIKSDFVTIQDNLTATLPKDCADVIKVGFIFDDLGRKEARYLGRRRFIHRKDLKDSQIQYPTCTCTDETIEQVTEAVNATLIATDEVSDALVFHNLYYNNAYGEFYGLKHQMYSNGIYTVDYDNNRLVLDSGTDIAAGNVLVVEYKSELTSESYKYIPKIAFDALRFKALSYLAQNENMAELHRVNFNKQIRKIRSASHPITLDDLVQACAGNYRFR